MEGKCAQPYVVATCPLTCVACGYQDEASTAPQGPPASPPSPAASRSVPPSWPPPLSPAEPLPLSPLQHSLSPLSLPLSPLAPPPKPLDQPALPRPSAPLHLGPSAPPLTPPLDIIGAPGLPSAVRQVDQDQLPPGPPTHVPALVPLPPEQPPLSLVSPLPPPDSLPPLPSSAIARDHMASLHLVATPSTEGYAAAGEVASGAGGRGQVAALSISRHASAVEAGLLGLAAIYVIGVCCCLICCVAHPRGRATAGGGQRSTSSLPHRLGLDLRELHPRGRRSKAFRKVSKAEPEADILEAEP